MRMSLIPILALLFLAPSLPARAASIAFETSAKCFDKAEVKMSDGGPSFATAQCDYSVNETFILRNVGTTQGSAMALATSRSVGVKVQGDGQLNTQLNTGFGVELFARAELIDVFIMDAQFPDGTPVPSGFLQINALAQGQLDFYGTDSLNDFSFAELNYLLSVGPAGGGSDNVMRFPTSLTDPQFVAAPLAGVIPWISGQPIQILMQANASLDAKLEASGSFSGIVEFGNSLDWLGITNVTDEDGNPVASFTAMSPDTGVDWSQAVVPEPASFVLVGAVIVGLGWMRRRDLVS